ncbi:MAG: hypothetical protein Q4A17_07010 [Thermoguttaceae bacterium]|nr:hypothetical protein [Thermoguttaceae bacterium]MBQ9455593.1 hypothetical protein [Thermoguttaceae bacterium]MDO4857676.1 hypothetical protein [Thermoguttaceae bacterium]
MKNRTLILLLLALLPLVILTGASLWDFFSVPPRSAPNDQELIAEVDRGKLDRLNGIKVAKALEVGLEDVQLILPLDPQKSQFLNHMGHYGEYRGGLAYVQRWNSVLSSFLETLRPLRKITSEALSDAEEMNEENEEISTGAFESIRKAMGRLNGAFREFNFSLEEFSKAFPEVPLAKDSNEISADLKEMVDLASERVKRAREMHQLKASFMEAQKHYEAGELLKCNQLCAKILTSELADDAFLEKVQKVHYKARAKRAINEIDEIEKSESMPQRRLDRLEELSEKVRDAGKRLDAETKESLGKEFLTKMNDVVIASVEELYSDEIIQAISALEKNPPQSFADGLYEVGKIAENIQKMNSQLKKSMGTTETLPSVTAFRERLQVFLETLLKDRLPADISADENIQEAVLTGRKTVTGYFKPVMEDGKKVGYKIYDSYEDFKNPTGSKGVTPIKDFLAEPGPSLESRCVKEYLLAREELLKSFENKIFWTRFLEKCEELQKELRDWESRTGLKVSFSLKEQIAIAKRTLQDENWNIIRKIFK